MSLKTALEPHLFGKWSYTDVNCHDISLRDYINVDRALYVPHTAGRYQTKCFRKAKIPIVERLTNSLMMHGRNSGKKQKSIKIVKKAFENINTLTGKNPIQVLVEAIINAGPREDSNRLGSFGVSRRQAVDVSPLRRVNLAIYYITSSTRKVAFRNHKSIAECLANEIIATASGDSQKSLAIKKKDEIERVAKANR